MKKAVGMCLAFVLFGIFLHDGAMAGSLPIAYYSFNNASDAGHDDSGNGHNGVLYGPVTAAGIQGQALKFDGVDDRVDLGNDLSYSSTGTVSFWVKIQAGQPYYPLFDCQLVNGSSDDLFRILITGAYKIQVQRYVYPSGKNNAIDSIPALATDSWQHISVTSDGSTWKIYINGLEAGRTVVAGSNTGEWWNSLSASPHKWQLGVSIVKVSGDTYGKADIDEVRIYDRALSADEVRALAGNENGPIAYYSFNNAADPGHDDSGNGYNGTVYGATWTDGIAGGGLLFDGVDSYADTIAQPNISSVLSMSMWVLPTNITGGMQIWGTVNNASGDKDGYVSNYSSDSQRVTFECVSGNIDRGSVYSSAGTVPLNIWTFLTFTVDSANNVKIYVNGVEQGSGSFTVLPASHDRALMIGKSILSQHLAFKGKIDEVRIYNRALSQAEVQELYSIGHSPTYSGGSGTPADPFKIANVADFAQLTRDPNNWDKAFILTADIDLTGLPFTRAPVAPAASISPVFEAKQFTGIFDGNGHSISNLTIAAPAASYIGLFGYIGSGGQVKNLGIKDAAIIGGSYVGGLAGHNTGSITGCSTTGSVRGIEHVGGLVGEKEYGSITFCYATSLVSGTGSYVGGLVGEATFGSITSCYATGSVTGADAVGGLVGDATFGPITSCYATGCVSGTSYVGGLVGSRFSSSITSCFWDMQTSLQATSAGGTGKTTAAMKTLSTFTNAGWDFSDIDGDEADWQILPDLYPVLAWEVPLVTIPDVTGMTQAQAEAALQSVGLTIGQVTQAYSNAVATGLVISQSPAAGTTVRGPVGISILISLGAIYSGGSGTQADPYKIANVEDFQRLTRDPNNWNKAFILTADIDLAGLMFSQAPIAPDTVTSTTFQGKQFTGIFDGNGHIISNLTIAAATESYIGLFGYIGSGGQVKNLGIEDAAITGGTYVGGLAGYSYSGLITGCYSSGSVGGTSYIGGLVGRTNGGSLTGCHSLSSATGTNGIGGLVGYNNSSNTACYSAGSVSGTGANVGGLMGYSYSGSSTGCFWDTQASGQMTSAGGTGKTTAEMKTLSTFTSVGWDFANETILWSDWILPENDYPKRLWEIYSSVTIPDLKGLTTEQARAALSSAGLIIGETYGVYDISVWAGLVSATFPECGTAVYAGLTPVCILIAQESHYSGGDGVTVPYQISTINNLIEMMYSPADWGRSFVLTADIDLSGLTFTHALIAADRNNSTGFQGTAFTGIFDGNGHIIRNLTIDASTQDYVGLFGGISGGQVKNLGMEDANISGYTGVGALSGYSGSLANCHATGWVRGTGSVGGLAGATSYPVTSCEAAVSVSGTIYVGGLLGDNRGAMSSCRASGSVSAQNYVGGLVGSNSSGSLTACSSSGSVSGFEYVGGLAGYNNGSTITSSYSSGAVSGSARVGGLVGQNGGRVAGTIVRCYSAGSVRGTGSYIGGLVGMNLTGTATASFWDIETSGLAISALGTGKPTAEMKASLTFVLAGWDFVGETANGTNDIWFIHEGKEYPRFVWANAIPHANAGADAVAYADESFKAAVELNGKDSNDADGDTLSYKWTWVDNGAACEANGVNPTIVLPVGGTKVTLVVNDGLVDSAADDVNVTVVEPVAVKAEFAPGMLNRKSRGDFMGAAVFPGSVKREQIASLTIEPGGLKPQRFWVIPLECRGQATYVIGQFERSELFNAISGNGKKVLSVKGRLSSGRYFFGQDEVFIFEPPCK